MEKGAEKINNKYELIQYNYNATCSINVARDQSTEKTGRIIHVNNINISYIIIEVVSIESPVPQIYYSINY